MRDEMMDDSIEEMGHMIERVTYLTEQTETAQDSQLRSHFEGELAIALEEFQEYKKELKGEISDYLQWCKSNQVPVYINYYRVYREL